VDYLLWDNTAFNGASFLNIAGSIGGQNSIYQEEISDPIFTVGMFSNSIFNTDPQFTDIGNGDYTLLPTSPAIDQGNNISFPGGFVLDLA